MLVDTRNMQGFGGGHIPGALNIGDSPILSIWAGWMLSPDDPLLLVLEDDDQLDEVVRLFVRTGYTRFAGYLVGGMRAWQLAGYELQELDQMDVHELKKRLGTLQLLDVRSPREWKNGHVPGAKHIFLPELRNRLGELERDKPTAIYCASGYRASIAASILQQEGFEKIWNVPGSWEAWTKSGYPKEKPNEK